MTDPTVYGSEPPAGPEPGRTYRELRGGPLDGQLVDVTGWPREDIAGGAYLITPYGAYGAGGRASYAPDPESPAGPWQWEGDVP
ncbi:hypothetical protein FKN01_31330 [Streptomyces sp. 130]|uniref:hypothetical protein n=1 Tax=Streptomyces sp. 130 TaxID=2591006 RepID=UPI0011814521|nr:hypothetical protein [Streptomyces sp. 130]TRV71775.1 hypothetical protein FKN01_31330 [Streptomyces sp. 130]